MSGSRVPRRVICYIDGFNLYFGLREARQRRYYWLDMRRLAENLLRRGQQLVRTKYFTARISGALPGDSRARANQLNAKRKRQTDYLDALATLSDFTMYEGHYLAKTIACKGCGASWRTHEEKMTDVNMATELLVDAFRDQFDTALLLSADSDLVPPVRAVRHLYPQKRIVAVFPPRRSSAQLKKAANASFTVGRSVLKASQLPRQVATAQGHVLVRPSSWN